MSVTLTHIISEVGIAVENANLAMEQHTVRAYMEQGYKSVPAELSNEKGGAEAEYRPLSYTIHFPTANGNKKVQIPVTALVNHRTLSLTEVDVKLKFRLREDHDREIVAELEALEGNDHLLASEMELHFKASDPSEGKARLESKHTQML